ncbi:hypothetical protein SeMB42_g07327 [Synchytrium endobioticum]|uniref:Uncharacterized protein n=1 Tax=Synchytrium endobioticum TaxID=286115 RepID=A0A507C026_9FUNG|nr:hypothetical protein SeMB42_g07327 [Synchytrium endobioticum]
MIHAIVSARGAPLNLQRGGVEKSVDSDDPLHLLNPTKATTPSYPTFDDDSGRITSTGCYIGRIARIGSSYGCPLL